MKSIVRRASIGAGLVAAVVLSTLQPAAAATTVTPVPFGPNAVRFDYTLDAEVPVTSTFPNLTSTSTPNGCSGTFTYPVRYTTTTFTVGTTGTYYLADASAPAGIPQQYQSAVTQNANAWGAIYSGPVSGNLDGSCLVSSDDFRRPVSLTAGNVYTIALLDVFNAGQVTNQTFSMFLDGPGSIQSGKVTLDQARAACLPGASVPFGYALREGSAKSETLVGTSGKDLIRGFGGQDTIRGLGGDDILCGGDGQDSIQGGDGADFVIGEAGNDTLQGDAGDDVLDGGAGSDTLYGNAGADTLFGGADLDVLDGGADVDEGTDGKRDVFRNIETRISDEAPAPTPTR